MLLNSLLPNGYSTSSAQWSSDRCTVLHLLLLSIYFIPGCYAPGMRGRCLCWLALVFSDESVKSFLSRDINITPSAWSMRLENKWKDKSEQVFREDINLFVIDLPPILWGRRVRNILQKGRVTWKTSGTLDGGKADTDASSMVAKEQKALTAHIQDRRGSRRGMVSFSLALLEIFCCDPVSHFGCARCGFPGKTRKHWLVRA